VSMLSEVLWCVSYVHMAKSKTLNDRGGRERRPVSKGNSKGDLDATFGSTRTEEEETRQRGGNSRSR